MIRCNYYIISIPFIKRMYNITPQEGYATNVSGSWFKVAN